jgi:hypothetical protein
MTNKTGKAGREPALLLLAEPVALED